MRRSPTVGRTVRAAAAPMSGLRESGATGAAAGRSATRRPARTSYDLAAVAWPNPSRLSPLFPRAVSGVFCDGCDGFLATRHTRYKRHLPSSRCGRTRHNECDGFPWFVTGCDGSCHGFRPGRRRVPHRLARLRWWPGCQRGDNRALGDWCRLSRSPGLGGAGIRVRPSAGRRRSARRRVPR